MKYLSVMLFFVLAAIAALHTYWAFGGLWPAESTLELVKTVIGAPDWSQMPSRQMTMMVAGLIFAAGLVALVAGDVIALGSGRAGVRWVARIGVAVLALVFLARGAAGYLVARDDWVRTEPFATYDLFLYSPLCLAIGAAFVILFFKSRPTESTLS